MLAEYFIKHFEEQYDGEELVLEHWMEGQNSEFYRAKSAIDDMRYLLSKAPDPEEWDSGLATNSIFPFCENSSICLEGKSMTPHRGNSILFRSSQQLPRHRLGPSKGFLS